MDTRQLKQNWMLLAFLGAFVVVFGLVGWRVWGQYGAYEETQNALKDKLTQLEQLQNSEPTPTEANLEIATTNLTRLVTVQKELEQVLPRLSVETPTDNIQFTTKLRKTVEALEDRAVAAKVLIPRGFKFGLGRYATSVPKPDPQVLGRLAKQLVVIEKLTGLMIESGVEEIHAIRRVEVEPPLAPGAGGAPMPVPTAATFDATGPVDETIPEVTPSRRREYFSAMPFELRFVCDAKPFQILLNKIATTDAFFVVHLVTLEQEAVQKRTDGLPGAISPLLPMTEGAMPLLPGGGTGAVGSPAVAAEPVRAPRLRVDLRLDYIEILPVKQTTQGAP